MNKHKVKLISSKFFSPNFKIKTFYYYSHYLIRTDSLTSRHGVSIISNIFL